MSQDIKKPFEGFDPTVGKHAAELTVRFINMKDAYIKELELNKSLDLEKLLWLEMMMAGGLFMISLKKQYTLRGDLQFMAQYCDQFMGEALEFIQQDDKPEVSK